MKHIANLVPRGFSDVRQDIDWLKLRKFIFNKVASVKGFSGNRFSDSLIAEFKEALNLTYLLYKGLKLDWPPRYGTREKETVSRILTFMFQQNLLWSSNESISPS